MNGHRINVDTAWLLGELTNLRNNMIKYMRDIGQYADGHKLGLPSDRDSDNGKKAVRAFEMLNREIGRGLLIVEILTKYGLDEDTNDEDQQKLREIVESVDILMRSITFGDDDNDNREDRLRDAIDSLKNLRKKREGSSESSKSSKTVKKDIPSTGNSMLGKLRDKFKNK